MNSLNIPQLRFPGFNGEWKENKLGNLGEFKGGGTPSTTNEDHWNGNIPWISSSDIYDGNLHEINIHRFLNEAAINESATKIIPANSILLVSRVGVGKLAINKIELCTSQDFCNFIPNKCNSYFVGYFLISRKQILINFSQGTSIKGFTTGDIKTLPITLPNLLEQQKIASFLNSVDEKIQQLSRKKELLEKYKKGVMQQLFSGKLRFKDENGKDYPYWEEKKLGDVATKKSSNISANKIEDNFGDFIIYGASGILKKVDFYKEESDYISIVKDGAGVGRLLYCKGKSSVLGTMEIISPKQNIDTYFLYCLLSNIDFVKYVTGSTIPHIYFKDYSSEICGIPSLREQQKIAHFLSGIDSKIEQVNGELVKTQEFKKGLLQQMFV